MRNLLVLLAVAAFATTAVGVASAQSTSDRDMSRTVRLGLLEIGPAIGDMNTCHGCPDQVGTVQQVALKWMKQLNRNSASTARGLSGYRAAFEAFRNYGYAAFSLESTYEDNQAGIDSTDHYAVYVRQYHRAQAYAQTAIRLLRVNIATIP